MADWQVVRFDETYEEKLDPEIVPLCDAMNAAGFVTVASCCGHGNDWPRVWFEHSSDQRIEAMARHVLNATEGDGRPFFVKVSKEVRLRDYVWLLEVHLNDVYHDTPPAVALAQGVQALAHVTRLVSSFAQQES